MRQVVHLFDDMVEEKNRQNDDKEGTKREWRMQCSTSSLISWKKKNQSPDYWNYWISSKNAKSREHVRIGANWLDKKDSMMIMIHKSTWKSKGLWFHRSWSTLDLKSIFSQKKSRSRWVDLTWSALIIS